MAIEMLKFSKKILKNLLLRSHKGDEAETLHKCLCVIMLYINYVFIAIADVVSLL